MKTLPVGLFLVVFTGAIASLWGLVGAIEYETTYCRCEAYGEDLYGRTYITPFHVVDGITVFPWYHGECRHHILYQASSGGQTDYGDPSYHRYLQQQRRRKEIVDATLDARFSKTNNSIKRGMRKLGHGTDADARRRAKRKRKNRRAKEGKIKLYTVGQRKLPVYQKRTFSGYQNWRADPWARPTDMNWKAETLHQKLFSNENTQNNENQNRDPPRTGYDLYSYDKNRSIFRCPSPPLNDIFRPHPSPTSSPFRIASGIPSSVPVLAGPTATTVPLTAPVLAPVAIPTAPTDPIAEPTAATAEPTAPVAEPTAPVAEPTAPVAEPELSTSPEPSVPIDQKPETPTPGDQTRWPTRSPDSTRWPTRSPDSTRWPTRPPDRRPTRAPAATESNAEQAAAEGPNVSVAQPSSSAPPTLPTAIAASSSFPTAPGPTTADIASSTPTLAAAPVASPTISGGQQTPSAATTLPTSSWIPPVVPLAPVDPPFVRTVPTGSATPASTTRSADKEQTMTLPSVEASDAPSDLPSDLPSVTPSSQKLTSAPSMIISNQPAPSSNLETASDGSPSHEPSREDLSVTSMPAPADLTAHGTVTPTAGSSISGSTSEVSSSKRVKGMPTTVDTQSSSSEQTTLSPSITLSKGATDGPASNQATKEARTSAGESRESSPRFQRAPSGPSISRATAPSPGLFTTTTHKQSSIPDPQLSSDSKLSALPPSVASAAPAPIVDGSPSADSSSTTPQTISTSSLPAPSSIRASAAWPIQGQSLPSASKSQGFSSASLATTQKSQTISSDFTKVATSSSNLDDGTEPMSFGKGSASITRAPLSSPPPYSRSFLTTRAKGDVNEHAASTETLNPNKGLDIPKTPPARQKTTNAQRARDHDLFRYHGWRPKNQYDDASIKHEDEEVDGKGDDELYQELF